MDNETKKIFEVIISRLEGLEYQLNSIECRQDELLIAIKSLKQSNSKCTTKSEFSDLNCGFIPLKDKKKELESIINDDR